MQRFLTMSIDALRRLSRPEARRAMVELAKAVTAPKADTDTQPLLERLAAVRSVLTPRIELSAGADFELTHLLAMPGEAVSRDGDFFLKEICRAGKAYKHPVTGKVFDMSLERAKRIVANTNAYLSSSGSPIPFLDEHPSEDQLENPSSLGTLGWIWGAELDGDRMLAVMEATDESAREQLGKSIRYVSIGVAKAMRNEQGERFPDALHHVAATRFPVASEQSNFEPLLSWGGHVYVEGEKVSTKAKTTLLVALSMAAQEITGLSEKASPEDVSVAIEKLSKESKAYAARAKVAEDRLTELSSQIKAKRTAVIDRKIAAAKKIAAANGRVELFGKVEQNVRQVWEQGMDDAVDLMLSAAAGAPLDGAVADGGAPVEPAAAPAAQETLSAKALPEQRAKNKADSFAMLMRSRKHRVEMDKDGLGVTFSKNGKTQHRRFEVVA